MSKRRPSGEGMIRKLPSGTWEGRIVVGHKENGDSIFRYFYGATQKELLDKLHQGIAKYQGAELTEGGSMTLGEWLDRWLIDYKEGTLRPNTLRGYKSYIRNYVKPLMGDRRLEQITPGDIQQMYNSLKKNGRTNPNTVKGSGLSDTTLNRIHAMLHLALKDAEESHLIVENPVDKVANPKPNYKPK